jgi:drug/metabolite transporter (DMT)-like permease
LRALIVVSLLAVYLIWGSTYLGIRIALESWPPFLMSALRFLVAGVAMYGYLRWRGVAAPTPRQWRNTVITGTLLLAAGNGLVCYAEQTVSSSLAAVAIAGMPLFAALFAGLYGRWPGPRDWLGIVVGFSGVILLNLGGEMRASPSGAIALAAAPLCWAFGSVWSRHQDMPDPLMSTAAQMLTGGAVLVLITLLLGEAWPAAPTLRATAALAYLTVFGSLVAFTAYIYLLQHVRPALATSYAYVNPPIAVALGVWLLDERFSAWEMAAMVVILAGVAIILAARR